MVRKEPIGAVPALRTSSIDLYGAALRVTNRYSWRFDGVAGIVDRLVRFDFDWELAAVIVERRSGEANRKVLRSRRFLVPHDA